MEIVRGIEVLFIIVEQSLGSQLPYGLHRYLLRVASSEFTTNVSNTVEYKYAHPKWNSRKNSLMILLTVSEK